ncbi:hypothetical protein [Pseudarthrobacter sp. H2]|uniref:hypothetical protein n=1 Tax=Pseudarthrobacter sp. H2 TaxID=3418415 RepID=UPI003CEDC156
MKTTKFQPAVQAAAALAIALSGSFAAVPAWAEAGADPTPSAAAPSTAAPSPSVAPSVSAAGLAEAIGRDLGMTFEEFNAAGEQARRAADAVPSLRGLPGYVGISLKDGKIAVTGGGIELQARLDQLNQAAPADFVLVAPAPEAAPADPASAAPAAASAAELVASSTEKLFQAYIRDVSPAGLQAVAYADGHFVIRTGGINTPETALPAVPTTTAPAGTAQPAPAKISPAEFVARYANVRLQKGAPIKTEEDLFGGQGYVIDQQAICSAGFGAFSPAGEPLVLTAGHCAGDGPAKKSADIETPSASTAGGATTTLTRPLAPLGTFGFSQFGGLNNSWITGTEAAPGNVGTDVAVIGALRTGVNVQPAATKWDNVANPGPTSVKIIGTVAPFQGQAVCRSGRTTGWSCGTVSELGTYVVGGSTADPADLRAFSGFLSRDVQSSGGDSGGPWVSGNYAVGTHSAGDAAGSAENFAIATTLEDSLARIPGGVQLQLFLNKPEPVAPANATFTAGTPVTGRVPAAPASAVAANSKVRITVAGQPPLEVPVDAAGNWSFPAPLSTGRLQFSAETVNGFSRSGAASLSVNVSDLAAPVITQPSEGAELTGAGSIDGTGTPGLTVRLSGNITASAAVGPDGKWSIPLSGQAVYGKFSVTAVQTARNHEDSPSATRSFTVMPPAPAVSGIPDGLRFGHDGLPATISGSGVDGAEVTVLVDGVPAGAAQTAGGRWTVPFPAGLAAGPHTVSVSQVVDGVASVPATATFTIEPAAAPPAAVHAAGDAGGSGRLANTGAGALLPAAGLGAGALLLGGTLLVVRRRTVRW